MATQLGHDLKHVPVVVHEEAAELGRMLGQQLKTSWWGKTAVDGGLQGEGPVSERRPCLPKVTA